MHGEIPVEMFERVEEIGELGWYLSQFHVADLIFDGVASTLLNSQQSFMEEHPYEGASDDEAAFLLLGRQHFSRILGCWGGINTASIKK
jgi:hypothetical protein